MPYTDEEHAALLKAAREEAASAERSKVADELTEAHNKVDTLEAEKAAAEAKAEAAEQEKAEALEQVEKAKRIDSVRTERAKQMKDLAPASLGEEYFTEARLQRWAEMEEAQFSDLIGEFADAQLATVGTTAEEAAKLAPLQGEDRIREIASILATHRKDGKQDGPVRETAAFRGGAPVATARETASEGGGKTSALRELSTALNR